MLPPSYLIFTPTTSAAMDFEMARPILNPVVLWPFIFHFGDNGCTAQANE
jgi:hypothetical protein